jgi:hypothetical protein
MFHVFEVVRMFSVVSVEVVNIFLFTGYHFQSLGLFYCPYLCLNIRVLPKNLFDWAIIKEDTIVPLILRLSRIDFSFY